MQGMTNIAHDEDGATSIEYGLIAAVMAVVVIACLAALGPSMKQGLVKIGGEMSTPQDVTN
ncbi:MAG TPA: Flp family type IVb pilin [Brevundimonas sp.]|nr:Flp family type IVb pilin [Brevundimonas sp.]